MAKYDIKYSCGHEDVIELFGKSVDRYKKIEYLEKGLCKSCYRKKMEEKESSGPLTLSGMALPEINDEGRIMNVVFFTGNVSGKEAAIVSEGFDWIAVKEMRRPVKMRLGKKLSQDDVIAEVDRLKSLFQVEYVSADMETARDNVAKAKRLQEKFEQMKASGEVPLRYGMPELLEGKQWNGKVYGRSGNYTVYLDGEKIDITNEQADAIKAYLSSKEVYG